MCFLKGECLSVRRCFGVKPGKRGQSESSAMTRQLCNRETEAGAAAAGGVGSGGQSCARPLPGLLVVPPGGACLEGAEGRQPGLGLREGKGRPESCHAGC